jgi:hypothetical protein
MGQFGKSPARGGFLQIQAPPGGPFSPLAESGRVMGYSAGAGNRAYACMRSWSPGCSAVPYRRASWGGGYGFGSPYYGGYGLRRHGSWVGLEGGHHGGGAGHYFGGHHGGGGHHHGR